MIVGLFYFNDRGEFVIWCGFTVTEVSQEV